MYNREKDLISDYLKEYPVLRYIMPSFIHNGINVSHRVYALRQAYWVLVQILNSNAVPATFTATNFYDATAHKGIKNTPVADYNTATKTHNLVTSNFLDPQNLAAGYLPNADLKFTGEDVQLLAHFLRLAKENFNANAGNMAIIMNALAKDKAVIYTPPGAGNTYKDLLDALKDPSNGLTTDKVTLLDALSNAPSIPALEINTAAAGAPAVPGLREIAKFNSLAQFGALEPFQQPLFHTQALDNLFYTELVEIGSNSLISGAKPKSQGKPDPASAGGAASTKSIYPSFLLLNSIMVDSASKVYLMCSQAQNSFTNAMGPVVGVGAEFTFKFEQDVNGLFQLKKMDKSGKVITENFTQKFAELVEGNEFCRAFGAGKADANEKTACGSLIADCLGENTHDVNRCRVNFANVKKPTKNFRGWNKLSPDERKYISYRILLGLGIPGKWNADANLEFATGGIIPTPVHSDETLKAILGNNNATQEHLEYIKTLMINVGTIETLSKKVDGVARPSIEAIKRPNFIEINPRVVGGIMGVSGVRGAVHPIMFGGAQESTISTIQYGGGMGDANKIIDSVNDKLRTLKQINPRALPQSKDAYIQDKLNKFMQLANEIDALEQTVITYIRTAAQHSSKDIVITEAEITALKAKENEDKEKMRQKIAKFDGLQSGIQNMMINRLAVTAPRY
jgi:hypothetical protein